MSIDDSFNGIQELIWTVLAVILVFYVVHYLFKPSAMYYYEEYPWGAPDPWGAPWEELDQDFGSWQDHGVEQQRAKNCIIREGAKRTVWNVIQVLGDGRCLFRCIAYAISDMSRSDDELQAQLADALRNDAVDALVEQRPDLEYIVEGDFDEYTKEMRHPGKHAGEPEILMLSKVLQHPISVYMEDEDSSDLKLVAEHGNEFSVNPVIRVWYQPRLLHYDLITSVVENELQL